MSGSVASAPVRVIDVRVVEPRERHPLIFGTLESLTQGENFEVISDHEPAPLHSHLKQEFPGQFTFEYLQRGPIDWHFRITRIVE
jgi:uncharacterized protein (DUF2249 family)